ncbi:alginate lyase family protein [Aurantibacter crassamenti]|uniref:alginate lyase family protein n=1 Tax=Aurantibacter crassamenti TaxID=1837375 RepID=UPI00193AA831|nr:alginate lyase family protein [Aurantibacter crassamenti]MBM1104551.1 alginate lyase family protein [Aurantibacter crassamenti]
MNFLNTIKAQLVITFLGLSSIMAFCQTTSFENETQTLISRLDSVLVESIVSNQDNSSASAKDLLEYYKTRNSVKHPINRKSENTRITEKELKYATDALEHVFVGQPAYPAHFCGDDINWNSRPVPDKEWVWQLNRMYFWNAMGKVYADTNDERYAKEWCAQLIDWTQKNPRDIDHDYAWRSIEAGIRGRSWTGLFQQFLSSEHFTKEVLVAFLNSCYDHAEFLMTKYSSGSNWSLMEAEGLAFIAFTFPEFKNSEQWKTEALRRFSIEINKQVYTDGHQRELAMGYHIGCINWFYRTYDLAKLNGVQDAFPLSFISTLEKMCEVPMKICLPDGTNAQFGDSWAGQPGQHSNSFQKWSKLFNREDFLYMASDGEKGLMPEKTAYALKESGIYSLRSGWNNDAVCMVLKNGEDGGAHCQPDNGTFTLYAGGRTLMPDSGSYIYSGNPEGRNWFRQTKAHQTLTLDGKNSAFAPTLLKWQPGTDLDILVVENESYANLTHRRFVFFIDKKYFVIVDEAIGTAIGDVNIHFQLAPGNAIFNSSDFSVRSDFNDGWNVFVRSTKQKGLSLNEEEGKVSFKYTEKESRPAFSYNLKKTNEQQNIRFATIVAPYENEIPDIKIKRINSSGNNSNKLQILLNEKGIERIINCEL